MAKYVYKLPDIGEGIAESEIAEWRVSVGDAIAEDQPLVDMLTEKANVEIPSPIAGTIVALHGAAGDMVAVGAALVTFEVAGETSPAQPAPPAVTPATEPPAAAPAPGGTHRRPVAAAPAVRKRARELGIDLQAVRGSGPSGRILREDLEARGPRAVGADEPAEDAVETVKVIGLRRRIAEAMQRSSQRIPHFAYVEEVDVTELEALRVHLNHQHSARGKLTLLPLLIQALVRSLPAFPDVNATFDDEAGVLTRHRALHVGIATQTPHGLLVPVLRHAQRLDLWQRADAIQRLAQAARSGKGTREELAGSTITITSLGAIGGVATTPIINAPEVAILGVNRMVERPVVHAGQVVVRRMMNLSSSFDHRIVDGHVAASFIQQVKRLLEHPATLFLDAPA